MAMTVTCPCGRQLRLDEQHAGKKVRCPICKRVFVAASDEAREPVVYDLTETEPARPARPMVVHEVEDDDEEEPEKPERIRRKIRRPSRSRGTPRPGSWPNVKIFDRIAAAMLIGALIAFFLSIMNLRLATAASETPQRISLAQLLANGPGNNAHVIVTDFVPAQNYVYLYQKRKYEVVAPSDAENRNWTEVWVPLVPLTAEMKGQIVAGGAISPLLQPRAVRVVVRLDHVRDKASVEQWCGNKTEVKGMVVNSITSLNSTTKNLLQQSYPGSDFSTCLLIHEGRRPPWAVGIIFGFALGTLLMVAGCLWFIFRFVFRER